MKDDKLPVFDNEKTQVLKGGMALMTRYHPFLELMGVTVESTDDDSVRIRFSMRDDLCGHPGLRILHGGVISCMIDVLGGAVASWHQIRDIKDRPVEEQLKRMGAIRTIDQRVDYLRPGKGKEFTVTGFVLRDGKNVIVIRMEMKNEEQSLIATGIGTFLVA
ncbi:MAG: thioesterase family protein [Chloroflexi bacterium]|nr:thioesterase family protein [Chloroflexota bacterium]